MCILYMDLLTPLANIQRKDIQVKIGTRDHIYLPSIVIDRSALLSFANTLGIPIPFHQYRFFSIRYQKCPGHSKPLKVCFSYVETEM